MNRLLLHSNAPWSPTGYGQQTGLFAPHLKKHYDLAISSFYGLEGARLLWRDIPVLPGIGADFGNAYLIEHATSYFEGNPRDGLVMTLMDVWVLDPDQMTKLNLVCWTPIDHEPPIPGVSGFLHNAGAVPFAMSRFGEEQLRECGCDPIYVPHGVDTKVFYPHNKREVREEAGVPKDAFLVGMVAANKGTPSRKGFQQALEAFHHFRKKHDDALLYVHTITNPVVAKGEDIMNLARSLGVGDHIVYAPQYRMLFDPMPPATMAQVYSTFDVLINPAMGEGFGVPILEAAACGVPAIVTNFSAMPEVAGPDGWHVGCRPYWTAGKSWQAIPDVPDMVDALEQAYSESQNARKRRSEAVRKHALGYDVEKVLTQYMLPALEQAQERFDERAPLGAVRS